MLTNNAASLSALAASSKLLAGVEAGNPAGTCDAAARPDLGAGMRSQYWPATVQYPAYYAADGNGSSVVAIGGCENLAHGVQLVLGYLGDGTDPLREPVNAYLSKIAYRVAADVSGAGLGQQPALWLHGHSLGGAALYNYANFYGSIPGRRSLSVLTIGSPKPGGLNLASALSLLTTGRWFGPEDPVPYVIPTAAESPGIALLFPVPSLLRFQYFVQPAGGIEITDAGTCSPAVLPSAAGLAPITSLAAWLYQLDSAASGPHTLSWYNAAAVAGLAAHPMLGAVPQRGGSAELTSGTTRRAADLQQLRAVTALAAVETVQHSVGPTVPPDYTPRAVRVGRVWLVISGDQVLTVSSRKKSAQRIARRLRDVVTAFQQTGIVDAAAVQTWFQDLLAVGAVAGNGFVPPIQTEAPIAEALPV